MRLERVTDWSIDFSRGAVWIATPTAWYRLLRPTPAFAPHFASTRRKFELALRAATAVVAAPKAPYEAVLPKVLALEPPDQDASALGGDSAALYSEAVMLHDARFLLRAVLAAVPSARPDARASNFLARLEDHIYGTLSEAHRVTLKRPATAVRADQEEEVLAHRNRLLVKRIDCRFGTSAKRTRAAQRRGAPPALEMGFGVDESLVGAVLSLYDLFTSFGAFLRIPPFPLFRLTTALSTDGGTAAASEAGSASGALLRDLHTALLRVAAGADVMLMPQPAVSQAEAAFGSKPWPEATRLALTRAPRTLVDKDAATAAQRLSECDYTDLEAAARVALLQGLCALALENNAFRDHMTQQVEDAADTLHSALPWERHAGAAETMRPWEAWAAWISSASQAPGRPLGADLEGRRYWVLGGACCWGRIFVEDTNGATGDEAATTWGWYPWARLNELRAWLQQGNLASAGERALRDALQRLPPVPDAQRDTWLAPPPTVPGRRLRREGMSDIGPDGYVALVAPLLRGGTAAGSAPGAGLEGQVHACVQTLLSAVPLWALDQSSLQRHRLVGAAALNPSGAVMPGWVLRELEALLVENSALMPEWAARREAWRADAAVARTLEAVAMAVSLLQDHMVRGDLLSRDVFQRICRVPQAPPLPYLPTKGEVVVVSRAGLRTHCERLDIAVDASLWAAMRPTERFVVECVAYRRGSDPAAQPPSLASVHTCWLLLAPTPATLAHLGGGFAHGLCVPIAVGVPLPEYVVDQETFDMSMRIPWQPGDRFKMFIPAGGAAETVPGTRRSGSYSKGTIIRINLRIEVSAGGCGDGGRYVDVDPWEAYEVEWDHESHRRRWAERKRLSPWLLEEDESGAQRKAVDIVRHHVAVQRAAAREAQIVALEQAKQKKAVRGASRAVTPPDTEEEFMQLLSDFWELRGKPLKVPTYFYQPLELYKVFCEVQQRGGFYACCENRMWKDLVQSLQRKDDLNAQTAAGYILKSQYEKVLVAFELFLAGETDGVKEDDGAQMGGTPLDDDMAVDPSPEKDVPLVNASQ